MEEILFAMIVLLIGLFSGFKITNDSFEENVKKQNPIVIEHQVYRCQLESK